MLFLSAPRPPSPLPGLMVPSDVSRGPEAGHPERRSDPYVRTLFGIRHLPPRATPAPADDPDRADARPFHENRFRTTSNGSAERFRIRTTHGIRPDSRLYTQPSPNHFSTRANLISVQFKRLPRAGECGRSFCSFDRCNCTTTLLRYLLK